MRRLAEFVYSVCYIGYIPYAQGTVASAAAAAIFYFFLPFGWFRWFILAVLFFFGVLTSNVAISKTGKQDPQVVVIDEVAGMLISIMFLPRTFPLYLSAFILFRFFDIVKPFPIRRAEHLQGGWGIMLDDVIAGVYTALIMWFFLIVCG